MLDKICGEVTTSTPFNVNTSKLTLLAAWLFKSKSPCRLDTSKNPTSNVPIDTFSMVMLLAFKSFRIKVPLESVKSLNFPRVKSLNRVDFGCNVSTASVAKLFMFS